MERNKIITVLIIINLILIGIIYNFICKANVNSKKQIIKEMTETEYEDNITSLNQSHTDYANYIEESKKKIASAITDMGVNTSEKETLEIMASNIRSIVRDASIDYSNTYVSYAITRNAQNYTSAPISQTLPKGKYVASWCSFWTYSNTNGFHLQPVNLGTPDAVTITATNSNTTIERIVGGNDKNIAVINIAEDSDTITISDFNNYYRISVAFWVKIG